MAGKTTIKPYKLKPSGDNLTRDDLSTWRQILLGHIRQNRDWHQFLPSSATHKTWVCTDEDETNGLVGADANATNKLRADFQDFLTCVATYAPAGFNDTIVRESTSFSWIVELIKTTFGLETRGENFLALDDLNFDFSGDDGITYHQAFMETKDFVCASLIKKDDIFEGKPLTSNEVLAPTTKNFIMKEFLTKVDHRLPKHVREARGHLFTTERPTLACNSKILCDQIPTMLKELAKSDDVSHGSVSVGYVPLHRGRGYAGNTPRNNYLGRMPFRGAPARYPQPVGGLSRYPVPQAGRGQPQTPGGCVRCLEATPRRYDAAKTHVVKDCPWPRQAPQQQANKQPNFRVVMFPDGQAVPQPQLATVAMGPGQQPQVAAVAMGQYHTPNNMEYYTQDYDYNQYFLQQDEYNMGPTISELPQQDL